MRVQPKQPKVLSHHSPPTRKPTVDEDRYRRAERHLFDHLGLEPTEHRLRLERNAVEVRILETGQGPPLLFVHGVTNSGASWASLMQQLDGFRCITLDRPGCGLSDPLPATLDAKGLPRHGDTLLVDVLDALDLASANVVSTSMGGYFALRTAAAHPDRVDRIVQLGWTLGAPTPPLPAVMRLASLPGVGRMMAALPVGERAVRSMFRQIGLGQALDAGRIPQPVIDCYVALLRHTDTRRNEFTMSGGTSFPDLIRQVELPDELLAQIRTPTLFLWGEHDPFGPPDIAHVFVARTPDAQLQIVPGAGHAVWLDDLDLAATTTRTFLTPA